MVLLLRTLCARKFVKTGRLFGIQCGMMDSARFSRTLFQLLTMSLVPVAKWRSESIGDAAIAGQAKDQGTSVLEPTTESFNHMINPSCTVASC